MRAFPSRRQMGRCSLFCERVCQRSLSLNVLRHLSAVGFLAFCLLPASSMSAGTDDLRNAPAAREIRAVAPAEASENVSRIRAEIARSPSTVVDLSSAAAASTIEPVMRDSAPAIRLAPPALKAGQVRIKPLSRELDSVTRKLLLRRVERDPAVNADALPATVFNGAVEMLSSQATEHTMRALALADRPLRYNAGRNVYEGSVSVGVVELEPSGEPVELSAPVVFEVLGVVANPRRARATMTAPPFESIALEVDNPSSPFKARIWSVLDPSGAVELEVPVVRPTLSVTVSPDPIQGWGLQKGTVLVQVSNITGGGLTLQVANTLGELASNSLLVDSNGFGEIELRSASTGTSTITVSGGPFEAATASVRFVFPLAFLLAALIGGFAGGLLRVARRRRNFKRMALEMVVAIATGAIVFGLFVLGVNVTGIPLPAQAGEVLVFVVAALGAYGGTRLLSSQSPARNGGASQA